MRTQICIATGQPLANLIPILHLQPSAVFVVVTKSMRVNAKEFKKIIKDLDTIDQVYLLDNCPDTDLNAIAEFLQQQLAHKLPQKSCVFNLTGGTKLHSFSLYETFRNRGFEDEFIYVDTNNQLLEYYPTVQASHTEALPSVLTAKDTLKGMGKTFIKAESENSAWCDMVKERESLTHFIAEHIDDENIRQLIGDINGMVGRLYNGGKTNPNQPNSAELYQKPRGRAVELLEQAHDLGLIDWHEGKAVAFDDYKQARYLSGIWLEEYVWLIANELGFEEIYAGLTFGSQQQSNEAINEIDLFIQHQNMTLAVECKSATSAKKADTSQDMFHKLTGVANRAGGLTCGKLFVSAFALKDRKGDDTHSVYHAREQKIKIVQAEQIVKDLPEVLRKWKDVGRL